MLLRKLKEELNEISFIELKSCYLKCFILNSIKNLTDVSLIFPLTVCMRARVLLLYNMCYVA